jgi:hypothetical protein
VDGSLETVGHGERFAVNVVVGRTGMMNVTPREFFEEVAGPNAHSASARPDDLRRAINAMMTLDAFVGILHAALYDAGRVTEKDDAKWKEALAKQNPEYELLRDAAYALKHGQLDPKRKRRIIYRPQQFFTMPGAFQPGAFSAAFDTGQVWIETEVADRRANEVIENVAELARLQLKNYGM